MHCFWSEYYEAPRVLAADWGHQRIFAPAAYRVVRTSHLVPVVHNEVMQLAASFPICWTITADGPELCTLRTLLSAEHPPTFRSTTYSALPKIFQAYPIVVPHGALQDRSAIQVDSAIADEPTDVGAPLIAASGRPTRATLIRTKIAIETGRALEKTRTISRYLYDAKLLEPWPLEFGFGSAAADVGGLMVVARDRLSDPAIAKGIHALGVEAATLLSAHRLSLFRISAIVRAARAGLAASRRPVPAAAE